MKKLLLTIIILGACLVGSSQNWDSVKVGNLDVDSIMLGGAKIWEKQTITPTVAYIILKTSSESDAWCPYFDEEYQSIVNTGATLHWEVTGAATYSVDTNLPVFDFSSPGEKIITITSSDNLTGVEYVGLPGLEITTFDATGLTALQTLSLTENQLTTFDATGLTGLQFLYLSENQLTTFDATGLTALQTLSLTDNQLTTFDATGLTGLQFLYLTDNQLTTFDATGLTGLQQLSLSGNQLTTFDATGLTGLQFLYLSENQLTTFDATGLTGFQELFLSENQLTTISINSILDQLVTIGTAGNYFDATGQTGGGCGDPAKIAALDAIWDQVYVDACP